MPVKINKQGRYEIEGSEGGVRFHKTLPLGSKRREAVEWEAKRRREIFAAQELGRIPDYTLGEALIRYEEEYTGKAFPTSQVKAVAKLVVGKDLKDVVSVAGRIKADLKVSNSTRNRRLAVLKAAASKAYRRWGWLKEPLHEKIELLPENPARNVYLGRSELAALLLGVKDRDMRRAALILAFTGLRKGELMGLKPNDIRSGAICLTETKTGRPRNVPILPSIRFALKRLPFQFHPTSLSHAVSRASGGKVRVHDLRHTCASLLINEGVDLYVVGAILGHSSHQTTRRYAHLATKTLEAAVLKLERKRPQNEETFTVNSRIA